MDKPLGFGVAFCPFTHGSIALVHDSKRVSGTLPINERPFTFFTRRDIPISSRLKERSLKYDIFIPWELMTND